MPAFVLHNVFLPGAHTGALLSLFQQGEGGWFSSVNECPSEWLVVPKAGIVALELERCLGKAA